MISQQCLQPQEATSSTAASSAYTGEQRLVCRKHSRCFPRAFQKLKASVSTGAEARFGFERRHSCWNRGRHVLRRASTETESEEETDIQIEGIERNYCDDFVCTSSPQVEQNIKAMARDTTRLSTWTTGNFRKDVQYKDAFLSFKGSDRYKRLKFVKDVIGNPKVLVTKLIMLDKGKARVEWRLRGSVLVFPVDIDFKTDFELDLITGRITEHTESWDLHRLSPPAKLAFLSSRFAWALNVRLALAAENSSGLLQKFQKEDDDGPQGNISADPSDPTKFFQDTNDPSKDIFSVGLIIASIWLIYKAYEEISKL